MKTFSHLTDQEIEALNLLSSRLKNELNDQLVQLRFFGSKFRGNFKPDSDIDVLLIVKDRSEKILDKIAEIDLEIDLKYNPKISLLIFSEQEYKHNQQLETPLTKSLQSSSVRL